jgi:phage replication O-like protein O
MADEAPSKIIPNTFQTPNLLIDGGLMALLSGNEVKCYLVVIRKTFGWRKDRDRIAKSQIAAATGLSETTVDDCMASLVRNGLVLRTAENNPANAGVEWAPQMDDRQIDYSGLKARQADAKSKNSRRTEKARAARGGDVQHPHHVQQPQGGDVQQPPQQPIKTNVLVVVNADFAEICKAYEQEFGALTPMIADAIKGSVDTYPVEWIQEAMQIAVESNKRSWAYVEGVLKNCKAAGKRPSLNRLEKGNKHENGNSGNSKRAKQPEQAPANYSAADKAAAERVRQRKANMSGVQ